MAGKIKGLTVEIGGDTTKLGKALESVDKQSRSLSSELQNINRLLKLDPRNTTLLAQKQEVLAEAISTTEERLNTLREAEKQVQQQFERGEVSEAQYRDLQREIIATENKLDSYRKAAEETEDAVKQLADEVEGATEELKDEAAAAKKAEDASDSLGSGLASVAKKGFAALAAAAAGAVAAIVATAEASREYRTAMGKLDTAFESSGHSAEAARETYEALQGILGETDQAVEAANHLAKLADTEEELAMWTDIAAGVFATFGDSLPIENLTEAANETAKTGQIVGGLADALNWAGESEEDFQKALDECSNEQERQALITKTLNGLYKNAATQYKNTNKEVIRANQATEKWNKALAKLGGHVEPVVTDIKELGASILEDAEQPIKSLANFVQKSLIPALKAISGWVVANLPTITGALAGLTAGMVAYKVATAATTAATEGMTLATKLATAAQTLFNQVLNLNPAVLIGTALVALTAYTVAYAAAAEAARPHVEILTEEEKALVAASQEAAQAFRDQKAATDETLGGITAQMGHVQSLADELSTLADNSGRVKENDQARAQFILNELNEALGTEYSMVDGLIQKYDGLKASVDAAIQSKLANSLLEAGNADYVAAIQGESEAWTALQLSQKDYEGQLAITKQAENDYTAFKEQYWANIESGNYDHNDELYKQDSQRLAELARIFNEENGLLSEKMGAYDEASAHYGDITNTINNYEAAQSAVLAGNVQTAIDLLSRKGEAYNDFKGDVDDATAEVLAALKKEAVDTGIAAENTRTNFENGVSGYTEEMVKEADEAYAEALGAFEEAYSDAYGVGEDLGDGALGGMESTRSRLVSKARSIVSSIISAMRKEADSHSPSRKTMLFGEDMGEGAEIGIENKTADVQRAATKQAAAIVDAYGSQELEGQTTLRAIADQQAARQMATQQATLAMQGDKLDRILAAIQAGQVLLLDGDAVVGGTAGRMDVTLGQRRALVARGAL